MNSEIIVIHPSFSQSLDYDFALVKLERKIQWQENPHIRPVCLPADASQTYQGKTATVAGWGIRKGGPRPYLQEVEVGVITNKV